MSKRKVISEEEIKNVVLPDINDAERAFSNSRTLLKKVISKSI